MGLRKFWMVVGQGVPYVRHKDLGTARMEAERLATMNPGAIFTVVESVSSVRKTGVAWFDHTNTSNADEIPF